MDVVKSVLNMPKWVWIVVVSGLTGLVILFSVIVYFSNRTVVKADTTGPTTIALDGKGWKVYCFSAGNGEAQGVHKTEYDDSAWYKATVPSAAHKVLIDNGVMPDPLKYDSNDYNWIYGYEWWYRKSFSADGAWKGKTIILRVEGVMEKSEIFLNGIKIGTTDGMYEEARIDISSSLLYESSNVLAVKAAAKGVSAFQRVSIASNEEGWKGFQYGKVLRPVGVWRGIGLEVSENIFIKDTFVTTLGTLNSNSKSATLRVKHTIVNTSKADEHILLSGNLAGSNFSIKPVWFSGNFEANPGESTIQYDITVSNESLKLWWPNGYGSGLQNGERYLYKLTASIYKASALMSTQVTDYIGIRSVEYDYAAGQSDPHYKFLYKINGEKIYMQGGNWVPSDALYRSGVMEDTYRELLWLARDAHFTMLRVWGGGIEENQLFYQLSSRYGICLIQEFWHKNEVYDANEKEWRSNADSIVKRLRNYPSIVKYSGGNELTALEFGDRAAGESLPYVKLVKASYEEFDNTRGEFIATSPSGGNVHRWENLHYIGSEGYEAAHGSISDGLYELGMNSVMGMESLKSYEGQERAGNLWRLVGEEYITPNEFGNYNDTGELARKTQLAQAIGSSYNLGWVKNYKWRNTASLAWAYNDMAPMSGWSMVDYYRNPKMVYYYMKREYAPVKIRASYDKYYFDPGERFSVDIHATNDTPNELTGYTAAARLMEPDGTVISQQVGPLVTIPANNSGGVSRMFSPGFTAPSDRSVFMLYVELRDSKGDRASENLYIFTTELNRSLYTLETEVQDAGLKTASEVIGDKRLLYINNPGNAVAFNVEISTGSTYTRKSDNFFNIMPGETKRVELTLPDGTAYQGPFDLKQYKADPQTENLALFKPIYASQNDYKMESGMRVHSFRKALFANDGDYQDNENTQYSQWIGRTLKTAWIYVDLGKTYNIDRVVIKWGDNFGTDYDIQASNDGVNWANLATVTASKGGTHSTVFQTAGARFVRMNGRASSGSYDVKEFEVYAAK